MKKIFIVFTLLISILLVGCQGLSLGSGEVKITVDSYTITVEEEDMVSIAPKVVGSTNALYYVSSNEAIFTVSNGVISGISAGQAELTIGVLNTEVFIKITVIVTAIDDGSTDNPIDENPGENKQETNTQTFVIVNGNQNLNCRLVLLLYKFY